jgi:NAD(P) transhydrogenase subunit alpha
MYARNVTAFLLHLFRDGKLHTDADDEITRETLVTQGGEIVNPRVREFFALGCSGAGAPALALPHKRREI